VRLWDVSPLADGTPAERVNLRVQVGTRLRVDTTGEIEVIPPAEWMKLKERLTKAEGPEGR
jgi:hypothetical protein